MTRRQTFSLAALMAGVPAAKAGPEDKNMMEDLLKMSLETKKGLNFFIRGNSIGGLVLRMGNGMVEVRNQNYGRIVIRIDSIDAVAMP